MEREGPQLRQAEQNRQHQQQDVSNTKCNRRSQPKEEEELRQSEEIENRAGDKSQDDQEQQDENSFASNTTSATEAAVASECLNDNSNSLRVQPQHTRRHRQQQQDQQQLQQQLHLQRQNQLEAIQHKIKGKITHRSQSSPSSLTTHKFGLRPTPSPPRLIIDHKTGDIIERYPEQPVYLRTYQPLDDEQEEDEGDDTTIEDSLAQAHLPPSASNNRYLAEDSEGDCPNLGGPNEMSSSNNKNSYRPVIPPPHSASGKIYFAPPETSGGHLFSQPSRQRRQQPLPATGISYQYDSPTISAQNQQPLQREQQQQQQQQQRQPQQMAATSGGQLEQQPHGLSGSHNSSFKRALHKLDDSMKTDIAIVTEEPISGEADNRQQADGRHANERAKIKITSTNAARANALLAQQNGQQASSNQQGKHRKRKFAQNQHILEPNIEDFNLYDFFYNFRIFLVVILSCLIIYLLVVPLNLDCTFYRPTYTYISIFVSSVNLTCIVIFSLFWYCSGVTRTLYANLSSSAFIITTYSILVAVNLALAVLFFFINTCHFQRIINTKAVSPIVSDPLLSAEAHSTAGLLEGGNADLSVAPFPLVKQGEGGERARARRALVRRARHSQVFVDNLSNIINSLSTHYEANTKPSQHKQRGAIFGAQDRAKSAGHESQLAPLSSGGRLARRQVYDEPHSLSHQPSLDGNPEDILNNQQQQSQSYAMSPIEAAWEYVREQVVLFKRKFYQFLMNYDLRFIGALHALCAMCLQYLAMKVAVVRSYFCSPVGAYA